MKIESKNILNEEIKASALALCMTPETRKGVFKLLTDEEIQTLLKGISEIKKIDKDALNELAEEFKENVESEALLGGPNAISSIIEDTIPKERASKIMDDIGFSTDLWSSLSQLNPQIFANSLQKELPQTVAIIISNLNIGYASKLLKILPRNFSSKVILALLKSNRIEKNILNRLEEILIRQFLTQISIGDKHANQSKIANIVNMMGPNDEEWFLNYLDRIDKPSAEKIRSLMFVFEDLIDIAPESIHVLIRAVGMDKIALSLKGSSEEMKNLIFNALTQRSRRILISEMESLGKVRLSDVQQAQLEMAKIAKRMKDEGQIKIFDSHLEDKLLD